MAETHHRSYKQKYPYRSFFGLLLLALGLVLSVVILGMSQDVRNRAAEGEYLSLGGRTRSGGQVTFRIDNQSPTSTQPTSDEAITTIFSGQIAQNSPPDQQNTQANTADMVSSSEESPQTNCPPGDKTCRNGYWYVCTSDGQSYQQGGACSNNDDDPSHGARDCTDGETKCENGKSYSCSNGSWRKAGYFDYQCTPQSSMHEDGSCVYGAARCRNGYEELCRARGQRENTTTYWERNELSAQCGDQLTNGATCNRGSVQCRDNKHYRCECDSDNQCSWQRSSDNLFGHCTSDYYEGRTAAGSENENGNSNGVGGDQGGGGGGGYLISPALSCTGTPVITRLSGGEGASGGHSLGSMLRITCAGASVYDYVVKNAVGQTLATARGPEMQYNAQAVGTFTAECTPVQ